MKLVQLKQIINHLRAQGVAVELRGDDSVKISQVSGLDNAKKDEISFLTDKKYLPYLKSSSAAAVILNPKMAGQYSVTQLIVDNPYYAYALVTQYLNPFMTAKGSIHKSAVISESAKINSSCSVAENAVIQDDVELAQGTIVSAGSVIESGVKIGKNCRIGSNVTICHDCIVGDNVIIEAGAVIGGDGFGWANNKGQWVKIPQVGKVVIGNDVSIGNNVTIDRGAIEDTVIENNCIIDNQVHVAHNVRIGSGSAIAGQAGFAGSTILGKNCTVAGQVGFAGHLEIADDCHFLAKSGVTHDIAEAGAYSGFPAIKALDWQKNSVRIRQLDKLARQVKLLEKQINELTNLN